MTLLEQIKALRKTEDNRDYIAIQQMAYNCLDIDKAEMYDSNKIKCYFLDKKYNKCGYLGTRVYFLEDKLIAISKQYSRDVLEDFYYIVNEEYDGFILLRNYILSSLLCNRKDYDYNTCDLNSDIQNIKSNKIREVKEVYSRDKKEYEEWCDWYSRDIGGEEFERDLQEYDKNKRAERESQYNCGRESEEKLIRDSYNDNYEKNKHCETSSKNTYAYKKYKLYLRYGESRKYVINYETGKDYKKVGGLWDFEQCNNISLRWIRTNLLPKNNLYSENDCGSEFVTENYNDGIKALEVIADYMDSREQKKLTKEKPLNNIINDCGGFKSKNKNTEQSNYRYENAIDIFEVFKCDNGDKFVIDTNSNIDYRILELVKHNSFIGLVYEDNANTVGLTQFYVNAKYKRRIEIKK